MYLKAYIQNLVKHGPVVSEQKQVVIFYVNDLGPWSRNDLDFKYSHTVINSINCLHLPTFRSQAAKVSEKSTVFTFSYRKSKGTKFDLAIKKVKVNPGQSFGLESLMLHAMFQDHRTSGSGEEDF